MSNAPSLLLLRPPVVFPSAPFAPSGFGALANTPTLLAFSFSYDALAPRFGYCAAPAIPSWAEIPPAAPSRPARPGSRRQPDAPVPSAPDHRARSTSSDRSVRLPECSVPWGSVRLWSQTRTLVKATRAVRNQARRCMRSAPAITLARLEIVSTSSSGRTPALPPPASIAGIVRDTRPG